jgi:hypothetical protein
MLGHELALAAEEIREAFLTVRSVEHVRLVDAHPCQGAAFGVRRLASRARYRWTRRQDGPANGVDGDKERRIAGAGVQTFRCLCHRRSKSDFPTESCCLSGWCRRATGEIESARRSQTAGAQGDRGNWTSAPRSSCFRWRRLADGHRSPTPPVCRSASPTAMAQVIATLSERRPGCIGMRSRTSAAACTCSGTPADSRPNSRTSRGS